MKKTIQIPKKKFETCIEILLFVLLCSIFIYIFYMWAKLPNRIPSHFDGMGCPDAWSGKESILLLPIIGLFLFFYSAC